MSYDINHNANDVSCQAVAYMVVLIDNIVTQISNWFAS